MCTNMGRQALGDVLLNLSPKRNGCLSTDRWMLCCFSEVWVRASVGGGVSGNISQPEDEGEAGNDVQEAILMHPHPRL